MSNFPEEGSWPHSHSLPPLRVLSVPQNMWNAFLKCPDHSTTPTAVSLFLLLLHKGWEQWAARRPPRTRGFVACGGEGGDNDHLETTYLNNCLLYNNSYSVALSLNSQWEGAAVGSWKLRFNQMSKQEPGALLRGGPSSLPQASFPCEETGLPLRDSSGRWGSCKGRYRLKA